jgi:DNA-binding response OmpR family regulator/DNA-binding CsgD family transcriptional regulator
MAKAKCFCYAVTEKRISGMVEYMGKEKILVVDDHPDNLQAIGSMLKSEGYRISMASDGIQGLAQAGKIYPDLILLDIVMPDMDGFETCRQLKSKKRLWHIPVIFLSAHKTGTDAIVRGFETGAADYIAKPFNRTELLARVRTHLEIKQLRDNLETRVRERTLALEKQNIAMDVLLEKREKDRAENWENAIVHIRELVLPYLEKLKKSPLSSMQQEWVERIDHEIHQITSRFATTLTSPAFNLTSAEIRVAALIREGRTSKEISEILTISESVVRFHRENIRKKLRLTHRKINLKTRLRQLETEDD